MGTGRTCWKSPADISPLRRWVVLSSLQRAPSAFSCSDSCRLLTYSPVTAISAFNSTLYPFRRSSVVKHSGSKSANQWPVTLGFVLTLTYLQDIHMSVTCMKQV
jgi:hypothetical protein